MVPFRETQVLQLPKGSLVNKLQNRIRTAYANVCHLCQSDRSASEWIERAHREALEGERRHRRHRTSGYKLTASDAACYFAVKWFISENRSPASYADACALRPDCLFALGAADRILADVEKAHHWHTLHTELQWLRELDYVKEFTK